MDLTNIHSVIELINPLNFFSQAERRTYWLALIVPLIMMIVFVKSGERKKQLRLFFDPKIWWHRSARQDYIVATLNTLWQAVLLPSRIVSAAAFAALVSWLLGQIFGEFFPMQITGFAIAAFTLVTFVVDDFSRFFLHYLQHRSPLLWRFHRFHHSAEVLTPFSLYRTHPIELFFALARHTLAYGSVIGVFFYLYGQGLQAWDILGVNALGFLFNHLGANLRHSHVPFGFGRLEPYIISPLAHQIHHSSEKQHHGKNLGACLTLWDRLFGSYFYPKQREINQLHFGFPEERNSSLWHLFLSPFGIYSKK